MSGELQGLSPSLSLSGSKCGIFWICDGGLLTSWTLLIIQTSVYHVYLVSFFFFFSRFLQVLVSGINPVDLVIHSPDLIVTNCSSVELTPLHRDSEYVSAFNKGRFLCEYLNGILNTLLGTFLGHGIAQIVFLPF